MTRGPAPTTKRGDKAGRPVLVKMSPEEHDRAEALAALAGFTGKGAIQRWFRAMLVTT